MPQKLNDLSDRALILSIEESLREFWANWGRAPNAELYDGPNMMRLYTGVPYPFCNGVICSQYLPESIDSGIEEVLAYFKARDATWEWIVGPNSMPSSLDKSLEKHGMFCRGESIGMAINLHEMNRDLTPIDNLSIERVADDETLISWANTMIEGFASPALYPTFIDLEQSLGHQQSYRRYLGILNDLPASTAGLFLGEKVAGIYCVSTIPKARGLGIGATITRYALGEALEMGYHIAVLQSSEMGRSIYQCLGFKEFSTLRLYCPAK